MGVVSDTRRKVYALAIEGYACPAIARRLDRARQVIHRHLLHLEKVEAIQRVPGTRSPLLFQRGPRSADFEAQMACHPRDRGGRSPRHPPRQAARVHGGGYRWQVVGGPERDPPWAKTWEASGVPNKALYQVVGGRRVRFHLIEGRERTTLVIHPPEEYVSDPRRLAKVRETRRAEVAAAAREFARTYGIELQGTLEETQPLEIAFPVEDLDRAGTPGEDPVWVDTSEGEGLPEIETGSPAIAAAVASLPERQRAVDRRLDGLDGGLGEVADVSRRTHELVRELVEQQATFLASVTRLLGEPGPRESGREPPGDPGMEVA